MRFPRWMRPRALPFAGDRAIERYDSLSRTGRPSLRQYWAGLGPDRSPSVLASLVKVDLKRRFEAGERPRVLEYLEAFPVLAEVDDRVVSLVYEEFCLLQEHDENPDSQAFCEAYGPWRDSLRSQLAYHRELSRAVGAESPAINFPDPGDRFDKYRLTSLLGVGGVARVYLATEEELGGRQVAIKVSASFGQEPSILAKLDHRNIVPILTVAESESGLRGICMPYRPGVTLEDLIRRIGRGQPPRAARAIMDALHARDSPAASPTDDQRVGWADFPVDRTFPEAVAWIGLCLARALSYLHKEGVHHLDIKPANILLAYREGPQLLDFNLAQSPSSPEGATAAQMGGTLPYMAPEQLKAFLDSEAWEDVEAASDLYSLGLVLRELLTGRPPELPTSLGSIGREIQSLLDRRGEPSESIAEINPGVPPALESIIGKCLAFRAEDRYADAGDLAGDLLCFLQRKPLVVAPNTSRLELCVNWAFRNRQAVIVAVLSVAVLVALVGFLRRESPGLERFRAAESHLDSGSREDWKLARSEFEELNQDFSNTARPLVGLALAIRKLGEPDPNNFISKLFEEAVRKPDADEVIAKRLDREPDSSMLLLNHGIALSNKGRYDLARASLEESLRLDHGGGVMALGALANVAQKTGREQDAIDHLSRAIGLVHGGSSGAPIVYEYRRAILEDLVKLIDRQLDGPAGVASPASPQGHCRRLATELRAFDDAWEGLPGPKDPDEHAYFIAFYEGCLGTFRGTLEADPDDRARLFEEGKASFDWARTLAGPLNSSAGRIAAVDKRLARLERRRDGRT